MNRRQPTNQPPSSVRTLAAEIRRIARALELLAFQGKLDQLFQRVSRLEEEQERRN